MRLFDFEFRELDRKWIIINRWKDIKRIGKTLKLELEDALVLAYLYIDHEKGICAYFLGNMFHDKERLLQIDNSYLEHMIILEDDILSKIKFEIIDEKLLNHLKEKKMIEQKINLAYYQNENLLKTREIDIIDEWRHPTSPDDLELTLNTDKKTELLFGKIELFSKDRFICRLLTDSKNNPKYHQGKTVLAKIITNKKDIDIVIQYLVEKKES